MLGYLANYLINKTTKNSKWSYYTKHKFFGTKTELLIGARIGSNDLVFSGYNPVNIQLVTFY